MTILFLQLTNQIIKHNCYFIIVNNYNNKIGVLNVRKFTIIFYIKIIFKKIEI